MLQGAVSRWLLDGQAKLMAEYDIPTGRLFGNIIGSTSVTLGRVVRFYYLDVVHGSLHGLLFNCSGYVFHYCLYAEERIGDEDTEHSTDFVVYVFHIL